MIRLTRFEVSAAYRSVLHAICFAATLVLGLVSGIVRAQVNIDQGKPPAEIFQSDCATCHKTARGLANGKNSLMLSGFLQEHYTASRQQAAALAAYVLGAGGGSGPPPAASQKPGTERAKVEEPKTTARQPSKPEATPAAPAPIMAAPGATAAPVVPETPASASSPGQENGSTTTAAAPTGTHPSDSAPVPRDSIPD